MSRLNAMQSNFYSSQEAHNFFCDAWSLLMDPEKKTQYDKETKRGFNAPKSGNACGFRPQEVGNEQTKESSTLWTVCPYCYYMYEYESVYEECCLRCQNCRRAFQAMAVSKGVSPAPSVVVEGKEYYCGFGCFALGYVSDRDCSDDKKVKGGGGLENVVEVSYGAEEEKGTNVTKSGIVFCGGGGEADGGMQGRGQVELKSATKKAMKNVKSMAKCTKKITGRGVSIEQIRSQGGVGGCGDDAMAETGFLEGEDDIF